ncbi:hypothetical protein SODALDRAFT_335573 [Sodiomyces alkalinus F11]|uniref:Uncharacterized protein n=1 Tax=Sodiomyces alkalinus (strain CBS 110278 / VKM F-3762 / F11) TaxID=1314773 RepID=A0A3N2PPQ0_SODAK|nr:hypothetical protein SODALDRAFT_335573 [Sodiomyces alkalinus F11]ROT36479.1 hypothetical protein SODALDRAFT_335573 [Sodiomyces alkalinus F11]
MCLFLSTVTQWCGCPEPVPTEYLDFPCGGENACGDSGLGCSTTYDVVQEEGAATCEPGQPQNPPPSSSSSSSSSLSSLSSPSSSSGTNAEDDDENDATSMTAEITTTPVPTTGVSGDETESVSQSPPATVTENSARRRVRPFWRW